jgi:hypothetical protein
MRANDLPSTDAPDYKWRMITSMVERNDPPSRHPDDRVYRDGYRFMKRMMRAGPSALPRLQRDYPTFYITYDLHAKIQSVGWLIEAALLTEASMEQIGLYVGQPEDVVRLYADIFYNVRPKLNNRGYVLNQIMFPAVYRGMDGRDFDFLYKILGFCAGWEVLREFLEAKEMDPNAEAWLVGSTNSRLKKLTWIAAHRIDVNQYNAIDIISKGLELQTMERDQGGSVAQQQGVEAMKSLLQHCKMTIMPIDAEPTLVEPRVMTVPGRPALHYGDPIPVPTKGDQHGEDGQGG